jgi:hypothetical protein
MTARTNPDPQIYCRMLDMLDRLHGMMDSGELEGADDRLFNEVGVLIAVASGDVDVSVYAD